MTFRMNKKKAEQSGVVKLSDNAIKLAEQQIKNIIVMYADTLDKLDKSCELSLDQAQIILSIVAELIQTSALSIKELESCRFSVNALLKKHEDLMKQKYDLFQMVWGNQQEYRRLCAHNPKMRSLENIKLDIFHDKNGLTRAPDSVLTEVQSSTMSQAVALQPTETKPTVSVSRSTQLDSSTTVSTDVSYPSSSSSVKTAVQLAQDTQAISEPTKRARVDGFEAFPLSPFDSNLDTLFSSHTLVSPSGDNLPEPFAEWDVNGGEGFSLGSYKKS